MECRCSLGGRCAIHITTPSCAFCHGIGRHTYLLLKLWCRNVRSSPVFISVLVVSIRLCFRELTRGEKRNSVGEQNAPIALRHPGWYMLVNPLCIPQSPYWLISEIMWFVDCSSCCLSIFMLWAFKTFKTLWSSIGIFFGIVVWPCII